MSEDAAYLKNLREYGAGPPTPEDTKKLTTELYNGPDRGAAVVLAAMVEGSLETLLRKAMREEGASAAFKYGGPMGSFSAKIQMGYALKLYGLNTRHDLTIVRLLRNQFAHSKRPIRFTTPVVRECCRHLIYPDYPGVFLSYHMLNNVAERRLAQAADKNHPRTRYFTTCNEISNRIYFIRGGDASLPVNQLL